MGTYIINDGELYHHGIKGMHWGVRHDPRAAEVRSYYKSAKNAKKDYKKAKTDYKRIKKRMRMAKRSYKHEKQIYKRSLHDYKKLVKQTSEKGKDVSISTISKKHYELLDKGKKCASSIKDTMNVKINDIRNNFNSVDFAIDE